MTTGRINQVTILNSPLPKQKQAELDLAIELPKKFYSEECSSLSLILLPQTESKIGIVVSLLAINLSWAEKVQGRGLSRSFKASNSTTQTFFVQS